MQAALEELIRRFGADTGTIHVLEGEVLALKAHLGIPPHIVQLVSRVPVGKGMAGLAVERNDSVASCNIQVDKTGDVRPAAKQTGVNGAIVVPMRDAEGNAKGALGIGVHRVYEYSDEEIARLTSEGARLMAEKESI
jgi:putative methionine-R-sulfoxide reductase with GAF domain